MALAGCEHIANHTSPLTEEEEEMVGESIENGKKTLPIIQALLLRADPLFNYNGKPVESNEFLPLQTAIISGNLEEYFEEGRIVTSTREANPRKPQDKRRSAYHYESIRNYIVIFDDAFEVEFIHPGMPLHESAHRFSGHKPTLENYIDENYESLAYDCTTTNDSIEHLEAILENQDFPYLIDILMVPAWRIIRSESILISRKIERALWRIENGYSIPQDDMAYIMNAWFEEERDWAEGNIGAYEWSCLPELGITQDEFIESLVKTDIFEQRQDAITGFIEQLN